MFTRYLFAVFIVASLGINVFAHKVWILPSQTTFSGNDPWVTVDAAVSNDLFYFNHVPLKLDNLNITAPDGKMVEAANSSVGKYRSVFDLQLTQDGTYRIGVVNHGLSANWEENGAPKRWRGSAAAFATEVPKDASKLQVSETISRVETFVTNNAPSTTALESTGTGIELVPVTHPNDLYVGEKATFRLLIDGQPASGLEIEMIRGGIRYRNSQEEMKVTTDASGEFTVAWPEPGMYWLSTSTTDDKASLTETNAKRRLSYSVTLEVLPE